MSRFSSLNIQPRKESKALGRKPRIGVDMTGLSKFLAAHDSFASDGTTFDGLITGGLSTQITSDHLGGLAQVSNLSFSVVNPGLFSDLFNGIDPENEQVQTFLYFDDGTSILDAERVQLFDGNISDFPNITYDTVVFQAEPLDVRNNILIGTLLTDSDAADTGQGLPEISQGKIRPIVYGGHTYLKDNNSKASDTASGINNLISCVYLGVDSSGNHRWFVADHIINELNAEGDDSEQQQIWGYDSAINRFVRLKTTFTIEQNTSSGCIISHANDPIFYDLVSPYSIVNVDNSGHAGITDFANISRIGDKDFTTKSSAQFLACPNNGAWLEVQVVFPAYDNQGIDDANIIANNSALYIKVTLSGGAVSGDYHVHLYGSIDDVTITDPDTGSYPDLRIMTDSPSNDTKTGIDDDLWIRVTLDAPQAGGEQIDIDVYQMYRRIEYKPKKLLPLYFGGKGKEYGSWINGRSTGEGFTETHANDDGEGNLIENGAGVIESILVDEIGRVSDNFGLEILNETDFATHAKWDTSGKCDDTGGDAEWTFAGGSLNGTLVQTVANRVDPGIDGGRYRFTFTLATTVTPDGDSLLKIETFSENSVTLASVAGTWLSDGTYTVEFQADSNADSKNFVVNLLETTATQGQFSIDDVSLKGVVFLDLDSFNIASNDLSTTKLSFAILEQVESNTLLNSILKTLGSIGHYDEQNRFKMRTYVSGDGFGVSGTNLPGPEDVIDFDPQTVFKIETGVNEKLDADDSGPIFAATLTAGTYTGDSLAAEVETQLEASGADNYTVTYSTSTGKFTLVNDTGNWRLKWSSGTNFQISTGRLLGFDVETDDNGATDTFVSDFPVFGDSLLFHPIIENTFTLKKVDDDIVTDFTVEYYQEYMSNRFQKVSTVTDTNFHAETLSRTWQHLYTNDQTTAEFYRDFLKVRLRRKHYEGTLVTKLSAVGFEPWDFANIRHPILNGILGTGEENTKWIVTDIGLNAETMEYMIGFVES